MPEASIPFVIQILKESPYVVIVLHAVAQLSESCFSSTRKSRCDNIDFCWGCCKVHRRLQTIDEFELDVAKEPIQQSLDLTSSPNDSPVSVSGQGVKHLKK